jgi:hypothetical protein
VIHDTGLPGVGARHGGEELPVLEQQIDGEPDTEEEAQRRQQAQGAAGVEVRHVHAAGRVVLLDEQSR